VADGNAAQFVGAMQLLYVHVVTHVKRGRFGNLARHELAGRHGWRAHQQGNFVGEASKEQRFFAGAIATTDDRNVLPFVERAIARRTKMHPAPIKTFSPGTPYMNSLRASCIDRFDNVRGGGQRRERRGSGGADTCTDEGLVGGSIGELLPAYFVVDVAPHACDRSHCWRVRRQQHHADGVGPHQARGGVGTFGIEHKPMEASRLGVGNGVYP